MSPASAPLLGIVLETLRGVRGRGLGDYTLRVLMTKSSGLNS